MVWCSLLVMEYSQREHHFLKQNPLTRYLENKKKKVIENKNEKEKCEGVEKRKKCASAETAWKAQFYGIFCAVSVRSPGGALGQPIRLCCPKSSQLCRDSHLLSQMYGCSSQENYNLKTFKKAYIIPHPSTNDEGFLKTY